MLKKTLCLTAAMLLAQPALAIEEAYQPNFEATVHYSYMQVLFGDDLFIDEDGTAFRLRKPKGSSGGVRANALLTRNWELSGEASTHPLAIDGNGAKLKFDLDQYRGGLRYYMRPDNFEYPIYSTIGVEYVHFKVRSRIDFDSGVSEEQAGEDPAADADNEANSIPLESRNSDFGMGHVRAGYSSSKIHFYGDMGFGYSQDNNLFEILGGLTYRLTRNLSLSAEYRSSLVKGDDDNERYNDARLGVGLAF